MCRPASAIFAQDYSEYADGYYSFEEGQGLTPPSVRKPPYGQTNTICPGTLPEPNGFPNFYSNLCGDLNHGNLPQNPMNQAPLGEVYPFELIRNKTLKYLSDVLPLLREDISMPKVAKFQEQVMDVAFPRKRRERSPDSMDPISSRSSTAPIGTGRAFCDNGDGILCRFFSTLFPQRSGQILPTQSDNIMDSNEIIPMASGTPCPSKAEYATPIFAKNREGLWRYVVQVPYEGYFTQTVEVTRCLKVKCNYMDGQCLSSPRWVSLLVGEMFYPNTFFPTTLSTPPHRRYHNVAPPDRQGPVGGAANYQNYLSKRAGENSGQRPPMEKEEISDYCDGYDQIGCFQIRLFYDWFLVPGACKCWKAPNKNILLNK